MVCAGMVLGIGLGFSVLKLANPPKAEAQLIGCAPFMLRGTYAYAQDGFNVAGDTAAQRTPFAQSGKEFFDGNGKMSGVFTASQNGKIVRGTYSGTYTLKSDCTGTVTFTDNMNQTFHYDIFVEVGGAEFSFVQTDAGVVTAAYERRQQ
jgi:hypothetical protein